ncbi:twin-arginine translocation signal domain-containing protein, partial [Rheinheimera oceanensis]|uniref:twin-arginine translocation signal domain-containing protein n=1 Tax=Rheinheimera oceanensis TaxID=2817449 RepID=UPI0032E86C9A
MTARLQLCHVQVMLLTVSSSTLLRISYREYWRLQMIKANTMMPVSVSRRRFVQGLAVGGVLATFPHIVRAGSAFKDNA